MNKFMINCRQLASVNLFFRPSRFRPSRSKYHFSRASYQKICRSFSNWKKWLAQKLYEYAMSHYFIKKLLCKKTWRTEFRFRVLYVWGPNRGLVWKTALSNHIILIKCSLIVQFNQKKVLFTSIFHA